MNGKHRRNNERGQRVGLFMDASAADFPEGSKGATLNTSLKRLLEEASAHDVALASAARKRQQATEGRERARAELQQSVRTLYKTYKAAVIEHPRIDGMFEPPNRGNNDQSLVAAARSAADAAAPFAALFNDFGLPQTFFVEMKAKADSLEEFAAQQAASVNESVNANAALDEVFRSMDEVIDRLHPVVTNKYRDDPAKLAAWESARRLERAPRSKPAGEDEAAPPPAANG